MNEAQRIRRVILICCHFIRNLAYYRAGWEKKALIKDDDFWKSLNGNFIDIAILEWCKLFADKRNGHHWKKVVDPTSGFEGDLYNLIGGSDCLDTYINKIKTYRDKFVAHLDEDNTAHIPTMDDALITVNHYFEYAVSQAILLDCLGGLPLDSDALYRKYLNEAKKYYKQKS